MWGGQSNQEKGKSEGQTERQTREIETGKKSEQQAREG